LFSSEAAQRNGFGTNTNYDTELGLTMVGHIKFLLLKIAIDLASRNANPYTDCNNGSTRDVDERPGAHSPRRKRLSEKI